MVPEMLVVIESHYWTLSQMKYHLVNRPSDWISFEHFWWPFGSISIIDAFECLTTGRLTNYDYQHYRDPYNRKYPYFEKAANRIFILIRVSTYFDAVHYLPLVSSLPVRLNNIELCFRASSQQ